MDRDHSSLIIILLGGTLLGGILFVLLVGRDTAISVGRDVAIPVIGGALGVALVVGTLALFIGYIRRKRREGQPWLFHFILWPAYIGVLAVLGLAALHSSDNACGGPYECVGRIPLYWLPSDIALRPPLCSTFISRGTSRTSSLRNAAGCVRITLSIASRPPCWKARRISRMVSALRA